MQKMDTVTKSMIDKIAKSYHDMNQDDSKKMLTIEGKNLADYLSNFHWDEVRFDPKLVLSEHKSVIKQVSRLVVLLIPRRQRIWRMS